MDFFGTFRGRLLLIFAFLTVATLGVQYYLNLYMQNENDVRRALHDKALFAGLKLASELEAELQRALGDAIRHVLERDTNSGRYVEALAAPLQVPARESPGHVQSSTPEES